VYNNVRRISGRNIIISESLLNENIYFLSDSESISKEVISKLFKFHFKASRHPMVRRKAGVSGSESKANW